VDLRGAGVSLRETFERLCRTPSDIFSHLPYFVDLCVTRDADHVIELGTRSGVSTIAWLEGLRQSGGRLTSIDIDEQPPIGDYPHWEFIQGDDLDPRIVSGLEPADIVFIDTSHLYAHTVAELNIYQHLLRRPGLIVLHDTELARPEGAPARPLYPVKTAVIEFCEAQGYQWTNNPECWGLATIEVV
jgi:predicted O-methyltransferase YrrM